MDQQTRLSRQIYDAKRTGDCEYAKELQDELDALLASSHLGSPALRIGKAIYTLTPVEIDTGIGHHAIVALRHKQSIGTIREALARAGYNTVIHADTPQDQTLYSQELNAKILLTYADSTQAVSKIQVSSCTT